MYIRDGESFDVIVAGAGCAGFCAAVQAGRGGLKTALFEHFAMPGGALTVLGSNSIDQFNNPFRPAGDRMVISGIAWEYVFRLHERGFAVIPDMDAPYRVHWQYGVEVNPIAAAQLMDDFLLDANVSLFYRQGVVAVDCTGDGDLCAWAGAEYEISEELQPGTLRLYTDRANASDADLQNADRLWKKELEGNPELREMLCSGSFSTLFDAGGDNTNHISEHKGTVLCADMPVSSLIVR